MSSTFKWFTVEECLDNDKIWQKKIWKAHAGKIPKGDPRLGIDQFFYVQILASSEEAATLQARQMQGLEALKERIKQGKKK